MAHININTTEEEQLKILQVLVTFKGQTVAVSAIAKAANMNQTRTRYVIQDLLEAGKIKRIPTRQFNKQYVRYSYEVC